MEIMYHNISYAPVDYLGYPSNNDWFMSSSGRLGEGYSLIWNRSIFVCVLQIGVV